MKKTFPLLLLFLLFLSGGNLFSQDNYHIGDIIRFRVEGLSLSPEEIAPKLSDFEVLKLERQGGAYEIWIRSFETGAKEIELGPLKLQFTIHSLLENTQRKDIYDIKDGDENSALYSPSWPFFWTFFLVAMIALGVLWLTFFLRRQRKILKKSTLAPWDWFTQALPGIENPAFLEELTDALKGYVERKFGKRIIGKTSSEILQELRFAPIEENLAQLESWFGELDSYKYARLPEESGRREILINNLQNWVS